MARAAPCVCGCAKSKHRKSRISVTLKANPKPLYPLPLYGGFYRSSATYFTLVCKQCDCAEYLPDTPEDP